MKKLILFIFLTINSFAVSPSKPISSCSCNGVWQPYSTTTSDPSPGWVTASTVAYTSSTCTENSFYINFYRTSVDYYPPQDSHRYTETEEKFICTVCNSPDRDFPILDSNSTVTDTWNTSDSDAVDKTLICEQSGFTVQLALLSCVEKARCVSKPLLDGECPPNSSYIKLGVMTDTCHCHTDYIPTYDTNSVLLTCHENPCPIFSPTKVYSFLYYDITESECSYYTDGDYEYFNSGSTSCCHGDLVDPVDGNDTDDDYLPDDNLSTPPLDPLKDDEVRPNQNGECPVNYFLRDNGICEPLVDNPDDDLTGTNGNTNGSPINVGGSTNNQNNDLSNTGSASIGGGTGGDGNGTGKTEEDASKLGNLLNHAIDNITVGDVLNVPSVGVPPPQTVNLLGKSFTIVDFSTIPISAWDTLQTIFKWVAIVSGIITVLATI